MWEPDEAQDDVEEIAEGGERKKDRPVVVLFGGREFKDSDRKMLEGMFPHAELRWCGSARDAGQGGERNLEQSITKGRVELVYIQTRHNGHNLSYRIINRCKSAGVEYRIIGKCGNKAIMKSESMRNRYRDV